MADIGVWIIKIACFAGASWAAVEWIHFIFKFDYSELWNEDIGLQRVNVLSFILTVLAGAIPTVALAYIGMNIQNLFR